MEAPFDDLGTEEIHHGLFCASQTSYLLQMHLRNGERWQNGLLMRGDLVPWLDEE